MITGDRLETASAIAKDAGLVHSDEDVCLTSTMLNSMSDEEVKKILPHIRVIARALPTDKSRMVRLCQEENLVVGMTGCLLYTSCWVHNNENRRSEFRKWRDHIF